MSKIKKSKVLKSSLSLFLAVTMIFSSAYVGLGEVGFSEVFAVNTKVASSGTCGDNLTWTLDDNGTLTISGTGDMTNYSSPLSSLWYSSRTSVKTIIINSGVTSIGYYAFSNCTNLTSITIPDSVTSIGYYAFYNCTSLTSVTIGDSVTSIGYYAFSNCTNLTSITIPDSVTSIGFSAFYNTGYYNNNSNWENNVLYINNRLIKAESSLSGNYEIKTGTKTIADDAFEGCTSLTSITIPDSVTSIGSCAFEGCTSLTLITIPDSVTSIGIGTFRRCTSLTSITIPDSVTSISSSMFYYCTSLTSITIPDSVRSIGDEVFYACSSLTTIIIPDSVTSIGSYAFYKCTSLTTITIPDSVTSIGDKAFYDCSNLNAVFYAGTETQFNEIAINSFNAHLNEGEIYYSCVLLGIENDMLIVGYTNGKAMVGKYMGASTDLVIPSTFEGYPVISISTSAFENNTSLKSITIPDSVTSIGSSAFSSCTNLTSIAIPDSVTSIDDGTFSSCKSLTSITIPDSVTSIGEGAFSSCTNLTSITIPNSVTSIRYMTFHNCTSLTSITITDGVTSIGSHAFGNCRSLKDVYYFGTQADWAAISIGSYNEVLTGATIHFHEHSYNSVWIVDIDPTCTKTGSKHNTCSECGDVVTEEIPEKGHSYSAWIVDSEPDCIEEGSIHKICSVCDDVITEAIEPKGHSYLDEWTIDKDVTCTEDGSKSHHCANCGDKTDITVIEATGHNYKEIDALEKHPHTITCKCQFCEDVITETPVIADCIECNFTITAIDLSSYKLVSYIGSQANVTVPATHNGRDVTTIANACFRNNKSIVSVRISEGITSIGSLAFMSCSSLEKVYIPASVTSIGTNAFYGFTGTIYCTKDSEAHKYAEANNINYVLLSILETEQTQIDYDNFVIYTSVQNSMDVLNILGVSDTAIAIPTASYVYGNNEFYGTGTIVTVFDGDDYIGDFTLIVEGDTNGDSVCDVIDCFEVERASNGNAELTGAYAMAADSNTDDIVDINDYQSIVNKALA